MSDTRIARIQLAALADYLDQQRSDILRRWRVATERIPGFTAALSLSRLQFNDHIPGVIDAYTRTLRVWPEAPTPRAERREQEQVSGHGLQRWQQGYQLRDLTREWGQLQMCLMDIVESYADAHPELEADVMRTAREELSRLCWNGINESTTQYWHLHQTEAAGYINDLKQALATVGVLERARAEAWREAAHDLRGSVTVVKGASSVLDSEDLPEPARSRFLSMLQRGVSSLHEMLNDLMDLARLEAGHEQRSITSFDAAAMLRDFCITSMPLADAKGLYLRTEGPDQLMVEGDRTKITRILQNLVLNALKYTERGGIIVTWQAEDASPGESWSFCVQDTGPGLDAGPGAPLAQQMYDATQVMHRVDDSHADGTVAERSDYAQTQPAQSQTLPPHQARGEGVGLAIVKRLCELLDAGIELETSPGNGSTFRVALPVRYPESEARLTDADEA
ncbi:HAMP domain-containing histidine kinase [Dyella ginsengisoli]|jgi:signal transduction histidine kinase|uniref:histidine kinase n=1 Tax=Dyella ginsengisoli TaxID=363848 RepID=A0ABW8JWB6_9GAMM